MIINLIELHLISIPLKISFKHSLFTRKKSLSFIIKIVMDDGIVGYGEGTPRKYVTNETIGMSLNFLKYISSQLKEGYIFQDINDIEIFFEKFKDHQIVPSIKCAFELALLDAIGKNTNKSLSKLFSFKNYEHLYSAILPLLPKELFVYYLKEIKNSEIKQVKIKISKKINIELLKVAREILGQSVDLRVDANCAFNKKEAIELIRNMSRYNVSSIEQPLPKNKLEDNQDIIRHTEMDIVFDESLCVYSDATHIYETLGFEKIIFNIRLSKCGGIMNSLKLINFASKKNIPIMLGCQVAETGILTAAGSHFSKGIKKLKYFEGAYSKLLLKEDIIQEDIQFNKPMFFSEINKPGIGVSVNDNIINKYSKKTVKYKCI